KVLTQAKIMVGGDIMLAKGESALARFPFLDAAYLNYTTGDVVEWLCRAGDSAIPNIIFRSHNRILVGERREAKNFSCGIPQHELFPIKRYRFPFCRSARYSSVITSFGCPLKCAFCVPGTFGLSLRPVDEVIEELRHLKSMGISEVLFQDSTINASREHSRTLFSAIRESGLNIQWMCQSRADCVNDEILGEMRASGCHTIQFGVESGSDSIREGVNKRCATAQYEESFALCHKHGIRPSGFFIIGLPGETHETVRETVELAKHLRCSTAVFGLAMPHPVTALGALTGSQQSGLSENDHYDNYQRIGSQLSELTPEQVVRWRLKAYASFYLRASYVWQRLTEIGSLYELGDTVRNALHLIRENLAARGLKRPVGEPSEQISAQPLHRVSLLGHNRRVAVIGGGVLGMTAAHRLASNGVSVSLIEKEGCLGGLSAPAEVRPGSWIDQHHHFVAGTDSYLFGLLDELGLSKALSWSDTT
ncbi:MAG TPA: radical SAM protein, partial [bacterium]|nr:radical SAM protein [bacterium]